MNEAINTQDAQAVASAEPKRQQMVADFDKGVFATSDSFLLATQMAKTLANSTLVPKEFQGNWSNCLIAIEQANRLGMSAFLVMQNMYIVYGRPSWSSKFLIAMINGSGKYDGPLKFKEELKDGKPYACTAWTTLNGEVVEGMRVDMSMAKAEGWVDKNGSKWKTMPQLMLRYRAASFFSSLNCPEVTMGIYTQEEIEDMYDDAFDESVIDVMAKEAATIEANSGVQEVKIPDPIAEARDKAENGPEVTQAATEAPQPVQAESEKKTKATKAAEKKPDMTEGSDGQMAMPGF